MSVITIAPDEGRRVRLPDSADIITEEMRVEETTYFRRKIADGDLTLVEAKPVAAPANARKEA